MVSHIAGQESIGLVAPTEAQYYETIEFYASLGFVEVRSYEKQKEASSDPIYCQESLREAWLINFDEESDETVTLKVRLVPKYSPVAKAAPTANEDWRSQTGQLNFKCRNMKVRRVCSHYLRF